ncbi:MAG: GyrI-like domain-containing protein [Chitinophagaceae bacterium]
MSTIAFEPFYIVGLAVRTTNENEQAATDIPKLWGEFQSENIPAKIPNKTSNTVYCVYTDYEKDFTKPYTTILGCKVSDLKAIPEGLTGKLIEGGTYLKFTAKGKLTEGIVINEWVKIWNTKLERSYTNDFEVYDEKAQDPDNAEVNIFVGIIP